MQDRLHAGDRARHRGAIANASLDQLEAAAPRPRPARRSGKVLAASGREVVEHANVVSAREQCFHQVRSDETGPSCDEDLSPLAAHRQTPA